MVLLIGHRAPSLALEIGVLFAAAAFVLPWLAARASSRAGSALATASGELRIAALDALTGLREVRAFAAEGRMLATVQAREATMLAAQRGMAAGRRWLVRRLFCAHRRRSWRSCWPPGLIRPSPSPPLSWYWRHSRRSVVCLAPALWPVMLRPPRPVCWRSSTRRVLVPDPLDPVPMPDANGLRFEAIQFRWQPDRPSVFDGLTLEMPEGTRVALLGPSGAGKSTLAALALKVVAPRSGHVLLGGVDIALLPAASVRSRIGWLGQATHLFDDTIRANLLLARPDADEPALWAALDAARVGDTVRALPDGLDTWVGEGGTRFSGGQGRRLALARALLSEAPILILDEPCSGLDAETERAFLETLNETAAGRSVILITHRLTGVERLDRIFRLTSFAERQRLFALPRSSWADYDTSLISPGGGVWPRTAKSVPVSPQVRAALDLDPGVAALTPAELISAVLAAPVDLLWNGGIGTYVKAAAETHAAAGDRANDGIRIDATQLRQKQLLRRHSPTGIASLRG